MFGQHLKDRVVLKKADGTGYPPTKACVQPKLIFVNDTDLPIEEGDKLLRTLPNGLTETFVVIDRGYHSSIGSIKAHYQCKVEKQTDQIDTDSHRAAGTVYNINGPNSRLVINSIDRSVNTVSVTEDELFAQLRDVLSSVGDDSQRLLKAVEDLETEAGGDGFGVAYARFIAVVSNHLTIVAPFLPALAQFIR